MLHIVRAHFWINSAQNKLQYLNKVKKDIFSKNKVDFLVLSRIFFYLHIKTRLIS